MLYNVCFLNFYLLMIKINNKLYLVRVNQLKQTLEKIYLIAYNHLKKLIIGRMIDKKKQ